MTILARLFFVGILITGIGYACIWSLATFVEPDQREVAVVIPASRFAQ